MAIFKKIVVVFYLLKKWQLLEFEIEITVTKHGHMVGKLTLTKFKKKTIIFKMYRSIFKKSQ